MSWAEEILRVCSPCGSRLRRVGMTSGSGRGFSGGSLGRGRGAPSTSSGRVLETAGKALALQIMDSIGGEQRDGNG